MKGIVFVTVNMRFFALFLVNCQLVWAGFKFNDDFYHLHDSPGVYMNGTFVVGGLFPIHFDSRQIGNQSDQCGRFNYRGYEEAKAMMYAIQQINNNSNLLPGIVLGADIKDTCMSVDFAVRNCLNFSFISRNFQADRCCCTTEVKEKAKEVSDTIAIIGPGVSDIAIAVTNLVGLFHVPVVDYSSSSRLLNNRVRFKYFFRTVSSDEFMSKAIVDLIVQLGWNFIHVLYSDTDYGRSAMETFEYVLSQSKDRICRASKGLFHIHSSGLDALTNIIRNIKMEPRAKAVVLLTTIQDLEQILDKFKEENLFDYVFIAADYYTGSIKQFKCSPEMLRRVIGVVPHTSERVSIHNITEDFEVVLNKSFRDSPWQKEYEEMTSKNSTMRFCYSIYVPYVIDGVYAIANALHNMLGCTEAGCRVKPERFLELNRDGKAFLKSLHDVKFKGLSRDVVTFSKYGDSIGSYDINIVNPLTDSWMKFGSWNPHGFDVFENLTGNDSFLDIDKTLLQNVWGVLHHNTGIPTSVCGRPCPPGHHMMLENDHQVCCWTCVPCTRNYISHNPVNASCMRCPVHYWPNDNHTSCQPIIPRSVTFKDPPGIIAAIVSSLGILTVFAVAVVFFWFGDTHVVRSSSRLLSYIMLLGILLGYVTSYLLFIDKTESLCRTILYLFSISFSIVVGTLLTKTNRVHRIFSKKAMRNGTPPCLSDNWMLLFIAGFVSIEILICTIIIITTPEGQLKEVVYSDVSNEAFLQCKFYATYSHYSMAIWWTYNTGIVLVCTYQAYLTRKVPGSYNEARFIAFTMMTISTDVIVLFMSYYGTRGYYKDVLVSMFLIIAVTVTLCCVFVPKVYIILLKPEKNVDQNPVGSMGFIDNSDTEMRKISHVSQRSCTSYLSSSSTASNTNTAQTENSRLVHEDNYDIDKQSSPELKRKMPVVAKNGVFIESREDLFNGRESGQTSMETMINDDEPPDSPVSSDRRNVNTRMWAAMTARSVHFEDEMKQPSVILEEFDPSYLDDIEYKRRKSTI